MPSTVNTVPGMGLESSASILVMVSRGHFQVFKYEVLIVTGAEVDGLDRLAAHHIGAGTDIFYLIAVHRDWVRTALPSARW